MEAKTGNLKNKSRKLYQIDFVRQANSTHQNELRRKKMHTNHAAETKKAKSPHPQRARAPENVLDKC